MKLLNRDTDYAVKALIHIVKSAPELVSVSELAAKLAIPKPFLRKILQLLKKGGVLHSLKGRGGGFRLAVSPEEISLVALIRIFQGPIKLNDCIFKKHICPDVKTCPLKTRLDSLENSFISELKSITLASLLKDISDEERKNT